MSVYVLNNCIVLPLTPTFSIRLLKVQLWLIPNLDSGCATSEQTSYYVKFAWKLQKVKTKHRPTRPYTFCIAKVYHRYPKRLNKNV